ncbi:MAG TPA: hypothetical protein VII29_05085 [Terriglobales bacterium]
MPPRKTTTTSAPPATTVATRKKSKTATSVVRTVGPMIPLAIALVGGGALSSLKPTPAGAPPSPPAIQQPGTFSPVCTLPFNGVRNPASDDHCGIQGGSSDPAAQGEATAKNNFCAPTHDPDTVTYQNLLDLQTQSASIPKSLTDRKEVENLGEGNYVSYVAIIKDAHYSDTTGGEAVNCNMSGNPPNDIHIVLMSDPNDTDECHSTTAEMSPHYRPANWTPAKLNALGKPVRIKGQLFYDNSHTPCTAHSRPNPKRASLWEIHPVYSIEVCKSANLDECRNSTDPAEWTAVE